MNLTKGTKRKFTILLFEIKELIDEGSYKSAKRVIEDIIFDLDELENKHEDWREKYKSK